MGVAKDLIKLFCYQKKKNKLLFNKNTLLISQNAIYANEKEIFDIFKKNRLDTYNVPKNFDKKNKIKSWFGSKKDKNVNANYLMTLLGSSKTQCCDISPYENPDFLLDLNKPVKKSLYNNFNNIVDPGTLEHLFNIPQALDNYSKMLKKNGYLVISTTCSNLIDHGFYSFSPTLFFDYFECNGFKIIKCYLKEYSPYLFELNSSIYEYMDRGPEIPFISNKAVEVIVFAQKLKDYKKQNFPIQYVYKNLNNWNTTHKKKLSNSSILTDIKKKIKSIIFFFLKFLPFSFEVVVFSFIRGKKIKKLNI
jgi:hypothetical protein